MKIIQYNSIPNLGSHMSIRNIIKNIRNKKIIIQSRKVMNTFLTPTFLWGYVIKDYSLFLSKQGEKQNKFIFFLNVLTNKIFWFWPSLSAASSWRDRSFDDVMGAHIYTEIDESGALLMKEVVSRASATDAVFLDLGCNVGRFLNCLAKKGYRNINGVDIGKVAIESMGETFPALSGINSVKLQTMQEYLLSTDTNTIDIVYTHGATIELIPATFPLVTEICRICKKYVVLMINENGHLFPRFWEYEFKKNKFDLVKLERPFRDKGNVAGNSLMVFKKR